MSDILIKKIERIEALLIELNSKIDNFLGFEELTEDERKEVEEIEKEIKKSEYETFDDVFGE